MTAAHALWRRAFVQAALESGTYREKLALIIDEAQSMHLSEREAAHQYGEVHLDVRSCHVIDYEYMHSAIRIVVPDGRQLKVATPLQTRQAVPLVTRRRVVADLGGEWRHGCALACCTKLLAAQAWAVAANALHVASRKVLELRPEPRL